MGAFIIGGLIVVIVLAVIAGISQERDKGKFDRLGNVTGKTIGQIVSEVGQPSSVSATADGQLYQWIKTSSSGAYHYALLFDHEGRCLGYTHQYRS